MNPEQELNRLQRALAELTERRRARVGQLQALIQIENERYDERALDLQHKINRVQGEINRRNPPPAKQVKRKSTKTLTEQIEEANRLAKEALG